MHTLFFYLLHTVLASQCEVALQCVSTTKPLPIHTRANTKWTCKICCFTKWSRARRIPHSCEHRIDWPENRALALVKCPTSWFFSSCFHMLRTGALGLAPSYWEATWFFSFCHREYTLDIDSYGSVCNSFHDCFCQMSWKAILVYIVLCMFAGLEWSGTPSKSCTGADGHQVWICDVAVLFHRGLCIGTSRGLSCASVDSHLVPS